MALIKHRFWIAAPIDEVYKAISTDEGVSSWWTEVDGLYVKGGTLRFKFEDDKVNTFKVRDMVTNKRVVWDCIDTSFPDKDWVGTSVTISLFEDEDGDVVVDFVHDGWKEQNDFYGICNFHWAYFLTVLQEYCEDDGADSAQSE